MPVIGVLNSAAAKHSSAGLAKRDMWKAKTLRSNTAWQKVNMIACQAWLLIWFTVVWP